MLIYVMMRYLQVDAMSEGSTVYVDSSVSPNRYDYDMDDGGTDDIQIEYVPHPNPRAVNGRAQRDWSQLVNIVVIYCQCLINMWYPGPGITAHRTPGDYVN